MVGLGGVQLWCSWEAAGIGQSSTGVWWCQVALVSGVGVERLGQG